MSISEIFVPSARRLPRHSRTLLLCEPLETRALLATANTPPDSSDFSRTTIEDASFTFAPADFPFTDADGHLLRAVRIATLPETGLLKLNGNPVTMGQPVLVSDLLAGKLLYTPLLNANGAVTFLFQVQDDGGTASGGSDLDAIPNTATVNIIPVNDPPQGTDQQVTIPGIPYSIQIADLGFSDPSDNPPNAISDIRIISLPATGAVTLSGASVVPGTLVTAAALSAGSLVFTPPLGSTGAPLASFRFVVRDSGGTANGGMDTDPTPNTLSFNVTPPPFLVSGSAPYAGAIVSTPLVSFTIDFLLPYDIASIQASDLLINNIPADSFVQLDADTVDFQFSNSPLTAPGVQTMLIAAGAITTSAGASSPNIVAWSRTFSYVPIIAEEGPQQYENFAQLIFPTIQLGGSPVFTLSNDKPQLFEVQPKIDATGRLTFTPAPNTKGVVNVTVVLTKNSGGEGEEGGDVDTDSTAVFTIEIIQEYPLQNDIDAYDVNNDFSIAPVDVLWIIDYLNSYGSQAVPPDTYPDDPFYDASGDNYIAPNDALTIINYYNLTQPGEPTGELPQGDDVPPADQPPDEGEGETPAIVNPLAAAVPTPLATSRPAQLDALLTLLATDAATYQPRKKPIA